MNGESVDDVTCNFSGHEIPTPSGTKPRTCPMAANTNSVERRCSLIEERFMRQPGHRVHVPAFAFIAALGVTCGGCVTVSPGLTAATPAPTPFVASVFTQCTVYAPHSGTPGRSLRQQELQISTNTIGACPQYIVFSNVSPYQQSSNGPDVHFVYYVSRGSPTSCTYAVPLYGDANFTTCELSLRAAGTSSTPGAQ